MFGFVGTLFIVKPQFLFGENISNNINVNRFNGIICALITSLMRTISLTIVRL